MLRNPFCRWMCGHIDPDSAAKKRRMQTGKIETAFAELRFAIQIYPG
jgi:hypothetical protein